MTVYAPTGGSPVVISLLWFSWIGYGWWCQVEVLHSSLLILLVRSNSTAINVSLAISWGLSHITSSLRNSDHCYPSLAMCLRWFVWLEYISTWRFVATSPIACLCEFVVWPEEVGQWGVWGPLLLSIYSTLYTSAYLNECPSVFPIRPYLLSMLHPCNPYCEYLCTLGHIICSYSYCFLLYRLILWGYLCAKCIMLPTTYLLCVLIFCCGLQSIVTV